MTTAFARSVQVFVDSALSPAAQSAVVANAAREGVAELVSTGQASPLYETYVDGRPDPGGENHVLPGGSITYIFEYLGFAVQFALGFLEERSPVRTGAFRRGFNVGLNNGGIVDPELFDPSMVSASDTVFIFNDTPYDRKVDVQIAGGAVLRFSVPPNLYSDCAQAVRARFGGTVFAKRLADVAFPAKYVRRRPGPFSSPGLQLSAVGAGA